MYKNYLQKKYKSKLKVSYTIETIKQLFIKNIVRFSFGKKRQQQKPTKALIGLLLCLR